jgi:hypothetical protein
MEYFKNKNFKSKLEEIISHKRGNKGFMHCCMIHSIKKIFGGKESPS